MAIDLCVKCESPVRQLGDSLCKTCKTKRLNNIKERTERIFIGMDPGRLDPRESAETLYGKAKLFAKRIEDMEDDS